MCCVERATADRRRARGGPSFLSFATRRAKQRGEARARDGRRGPAARDSLVGPGGERRILRRPLRRLGGRRRPGGRRQRRGCLDAREGGLPVACAPDTGLPVMGPTADLLYELLRAADGSAAWRAGAWPMRTAAPEGCQCSSKKNLSVRCTMEYTEPGAGVCKACASSRYKHGHLPGCRKARPSFLGRTHGDRARHLQNVNERS